MRKVVVAASGCLLLAACGGGSGGGSQSLAVVASTPVATPTPSPTPTPTPTPTATPAPTATPTPTASSANYTRYADLTGDRSFATACAAVVGASGLPTPQPAAGFGDALTLGYTASTGGWTVGGDGVSLAFAASDAVSAPAGQKIFEKTVGGSVQHLAIIDPVVAGTTLGYTRSLALRTDRAQGSTLYSCVFGVPALPADVPTTSVSYATVSVSGSATLVDTSGNAQSYGLSGSTATVGYDAGGAAVTITVHLIGSVAGTATTVDLGTFTGSGAVEAARARFAGTLDSSDHISLFSSFSGAFFGGSEAGAAFEVMGADTASGARVAAVGTVAASR